MRRQRLYSARMESRCGVRHEVLCPDRKTIEEYVAEKLLAGYSLYREIERGNGLYLVDEKEIIVNVF